jgi:hypothetical protein
LAAGDTTVGSRPARDGVAAAAAAAASMSATVILPDASSRSTIAASGSDLRRGRPHVFKRYLPVEQQVQQDHDPHYARQGRFHLLIGAG